MAYSTIPKSSSYFNTKLYTGNGSAQSITGVGFQPDWCWLKSRATANHRAFDAVRGATKAIYPSLSNAEGTSSAELNAFNSDGFTLGSEANVNANGVNFASWNWKANGSGSANGDGTISSTVSVDTTSGFSIVKYTGNAVVGATVGHGLGVAPKMIIVKNLTSGSTDWVVYFQALGNTKRIKLNTTAAEETNAFWYDTTPTSSVWSMNDNGDGNANGSDYIAYCFAEKQGFSKFDLYQGNSNSNGPFIYTGFKPTWIIIKQATGGNANEVWRMMDGTINPTNTVQKFLVANNNAAEATSSSNTISMFSNGFKINTGGENSMNTNYGYIYMAFGQPIVSTNGDIATAR